MGFARKRPTLIGIDISSTCIKMVELSRSGQGYRVEGYSVEPLPGGAIMEKAIQDVEAVGQAIKAAHRRIGTGTKICALAVPSSAVITKTLTLPANLKEEDLEAQIQLEADQYIPYTLEEVHMDFEVIGPAPKNPAQIEVLLCASRSENVEMRQAAAEMAGLKTQLMDVESYATEHAYPLLAQQTPDMDPDGLVAIVDVGATMTAINILQQQKLIYTREQPFGGKLLTEEIMRQFGLSYDEAGRAKKIGGLPDSYVPNALAPFKETMTQQIIRFLQYFHATNGDTQVDRIILAGGCAAISGVDQQIQSRLGTPTQVGNPFANMTLHPRVDLKRLSNDAPALMIACGLAMRSFD
nr:pilus assembly protein PilM [Ectothiorhodospira magna]